MKLHPGQLVLINDHGVRVARVQFVLGDTAHLELQGQFFHTMPVEVPVDEVMRYDGQEPNYAGFVK